MKKLLYRLLYSLKHDGRDWTVFSLSLLLAFSIWLIHNLSLNYSDFLTIRMVAECDNLEGHMVSSSNSCEVVARCRTSGYNIIKSKIALNRTPVRIRFDVQSLAHRSGEMYYITRTQLNEAAHLIYGEKVNVEYFLSDTLFFRFPYETSKRVPVFPVASIDFEPQYMTTDNLEIEPDSVTIYGEPYHLANVDRVFTETIKLRTSDRHFLLWQHFSLLVEMALLAVVGFLPLSVPDAVVNVTISFVCSVQVQSFRKTRGLPYATTMCTGNLRSAADCFSVFLFQKDPLALRSCLRYLLIIFCFCAGAAAGAGCSQWLGAGAVWLCCGALGLVFAVMALGKKALAQM